MTSDTWLGYRHHVAVSKPNSKTIVSEFDSYWEAHIITQIIFHGKHVTQCHFLSGLQLVLIKNFLSPKLVAKQSLNNSYLLAGEKDEHVFHFIKSKRKSSWPPSHTHTHTHTHAHICKHKRIYVFMRACIYPHPSPWAVCDTRSIFKRSIY